MVKIICMFALAGLVAGAPSAIRVPSTLDQETVISRIMNSLQPSIDAAIAKALGEGSYSSVAVLETVGPVQYEGAVGNTNYKGSYGAEKSSFSAAYDSNSANAAGYVDGFNFESNVAIPAGLGGANYLVEENIESNIAGAYQPLPGVIAPVGEIELDVYQPEDLEQQTYAMEMLNRANAQKVQSSRFQTAGVAGVVYQESGNQLSSYEQIAKENYASQVKTQENIPKAVASVATNQQQQLVQGVMSALVPSIEAAVQAALLNMQQSTVASSTFTTGSQQTTGQVSAVSTVSQSASSSSQKMTEQEERALVMRIIEVLTPSITTSVRKALAMRVQASQQSTATTSTSTGSSHFQTAGAGGVVFHGNSNNQQSSAFNANQAQQIQQSSFGSSNTATQGNANKGSVHFQTAGAGGVVYHDSNKQQSSAQQVQQSSFGATSSQFNSQASQASSSTDSSKLVAQIVAALKPSISLSVQEALEASRLSNTQVVSSQAVNAGSSFSSQAASSGFSSQSSGGSLSSIFGDGKAHNVRVETPNYKIEYNN